MIKVTFTFPTDPIERSERFNRAVSDAYALILAEVPAHRVGKLEIEMESLLISYDVAKVDGGISFVERGDAH